jgi:hypothetical protein
LFALWLVAGLAISRYCDFKRFAIMKSQKVAGGVKVKEESRTPEKMDHGRMLAT